MQEGYCTAHICSMLMSKQMVMGYGATGYGLYRSTDIPYANKCRLLSDSWQNTLSQLLNEPHNYAQVLSGGADQRVRLWDVEGSLLASLDLGFQVTSLCCGDVFAAAGGHRGEMQVLVLDPEGQGNKASKKEVEQVNDKPPSVTKVG